MSDHERFSVTLKELYASQCAVLAWTEMAKKESGNRIYLQFAQERLKGLNSGLKALLYYFGLAPEDHANLFTEEPFEDYEQVFVWCRDVKSLLLKLESFFSLEQIL